ncbi:unnamed protein product [Symbiodinium natans]|uniref:Uncharacterized protein n=1 Tax=Symbiodinium natans TaxID=878477 RepID=A0A812M3A0_9DINO|nr:unnamed protein product [Symbiodinium natans]
MADDQDASVASDSIQSTGRTVPNDSECRRYSDLEPARSAYDNFLLSFLKSDSGRLALKPWLLLVLNFLAQYVVVYLLWQKINGSERDAATALLDRSGNGASSLCFEVADVNARFHHGQLGLSCSPDEVTLFTNFSVLDLDGDGMWTHEEAQRLDSLYESLAGRYVRMSWVYQRVFKLLWLHARALVLPCKIDDSLQAFWSDDGFWYDATLMAISSSGKARVRFHDDNATGSVKASELRKLVGDTFFRCSVPKCVDTDAGATDSEWSTCVDYDEYYGECAEGRYDDADFQVAKLCCLCGGGTTSLALAGIGHLPVNLSLDVVTQPRSYRSCVQQAHSSESQAACMRNFTFIPEDLYARELAPFVGFCSCQMGIFVTAWTLRCCVAMLATGTSRFLFPSPCCSNTLALTPSTISTCGSYAKRAWRPSAGYLHAPVKPFQGRTQ